MNLQLNYEDFESYLVEDYPTTRFNGGIQYVFKFENGFGASVVKFPGSYGWRNDLWELGTLMFDNDAGYILKKYSEFEDSVIGYLTDEEVRKLLNHIKAK